MKAFTPSFVSGFTLVETLVAIAIISLAILGPFHVVQGVLQSSYIARDQLIATSLGQEGMEYVRSVRDGNFIYNTHNAGNLTWLNGLDGNNGPDCYSNACRIDAGQQTVVSCNGASCAAFPLYLSASNLYNQQNNGTQTRFTRQIRLTAISATETLVTVTVSWTSHGTHSVVLTENLQNWL